MVGVFTEDGFAFIATGQDVIPPGGPLNAQWTCQGLLRQYNVTSSTRICPNDKA